jgi:UDP-glucose 6-dehydrogenase
LIRKGDEPARLIQVDCSASVQQLKTQVAYIYEEQINKIILVYLGRKLVKGSLRANRFVQNAVICVGTVTKEKKAISKSYMFSNPYTVDPPV